MRRIKAGGGKTFAHVLGKGTIEIRRQKQRFIITGTDFQIIGTSPDDKEKLVLQVENGYLVEEGLEFKDDGDPTDEEREKLEQQAANEPKPEDTEQSALDPNKPKEDEEETLE